MKADIHIKHCEVVFQDLSGDLVIKTRSTVQTKEAIEFEGRDDLLVKVEVAGKPRPIYTSWRADEFRRCSGK